MFGALGAWSACPPGLADACSACIGPGGDVRGLGAGFYWSMLFLTLLPFVLAAAVAVSIGALVRRAHPGPAPFVAAGGRREGGDD